MKQYQKKLAEKGEIETSETTPFNKGSFGADLLLYYKSVSTGIIP